MRRRISIYVFVNSIRKYVNKKKVGLQRYFPSSFPTFPPFTIAMTQAISPPLPSAELIAQKKNLMPPVPAEDDKRIKRRQRRAKSIPSDMSDYIKHLQLPLDSATNNFGPLSHLIW